MPGGGGPKCMKTGDAKQVLNTFQFKLSVEGGGGSRRTFWRPTTTCALLKPKFIEFKYCIVRVEKFTSIFNFTCEHQILHLRIWHLWRFRQQHFLDAHSNHNRNAPLRQIPPFHYSIFTPYTKHSPSDRLERPPLRSAYETMTIITIAVSFYHTIL